MRETIVTVTYTCDVCGEIATTPRGLPDGWRDVRIAQYSEQDSEKHVCANVDPSCFRRLLIQLANEDTQR